MQGAHAYIWDRVYMYTYVVAIGICARTDSRDGYVCSAPPARLAGHRS